MNAGRAVRERANGVRGQFRTSVFGGGFLARREAGATQQDEDRREEELSNVRHEKDGDVEIDEVIT